MSTSLILSRGDTQHLIVQHLDQGSTSALDMMSPNAFESPLLQTRTGSRRATGPSSIVIPMASMESMSVSGAGSPSSSGADYDTLGSTDTEMTSEEDDCDFQFPLDIARRLSLLPKFHSGPSLPTLPAELQLEIFSYLDKIDSTCLGLTSPKAYGIYTAIHGTKMELSTRRVGPNSLESAWEVVGKQQCKHCGVYRCELYQHIKTWMPESLEYCTFKQNFGIPAGNSANATCYRGKPSKPKRCGRHPLRTTSMHQDDALSKI